MKDRIKTIRKELNLTQQQFADKLGVRRNTVAQWETGVNQITEQTIKAICTLFDVSEDWLKEGTGDIFITVSRDEEISKFLGRLQNEPDNSFAKQFIHVLSQLDVDEWKTLQKIMLMMSVAKKD